MTVINTKNNNNKLPVVRSRGLRKSNFSSSLTLETNGSLGLFKELISKPNAVLVTTSKLYPPKNLKLTKINQIKSKQHAEILVTT